jgi:hypothetical protein
LDVNQPSRAVTIQRLKKAADPIASVLALQISNSGKYLQELLSGFTNRQSDFAHTTGFRWQ